MVVCGVQFMGARYLSDAQVGQGMRRWLTMHNLVEFRRSEVVAALSHALDMTEGQPIGHAGRSCLVGMRVGELIGLTQAQLGSLYYALLLKDAGCSSSAARLTEIFGGADDIELKRAAKLVDFARPSEAIRFVTHQAGTGSGLARSREIVAAALAFKRHGGEVVAARCDRGARIVAKLGFPGESAGAVRSLDERWDGKGRPDGLAGDAIPVLARVACLAQHVDFFLTAVGRGGARDMVARRRGTWFDPQIADAFLALRASDRLWASLARADSPDTLAIHEPGEEIATLLDDDLDRIAVAFADVIDAKSPFTADHSRGVARAAVAIARVLGLTDDEIRTLNRAALLHDIGKLGISNAILDKQGPLTADERMLMQAHPRYTEEILSRVAAFAPIAFVAGAHHERIDAMGYHRGIGGDDLPRDARILAVADVFDALHADRPYRAGMPLERIMGIMHADVGTAFDPEMVAALVECVDELVDVREAPGRQRMALDIA